MHLSLLFGGFSCFLFVGWFFSFLLLFSHYSSIIFYSNAIYVEITHHQCGYLLLHLLLSLHLSEVVSTPLLLSTTLLLPLLLYSCQLLLYSCLLLLYSCLYYCLFSTLVSTQLLSTPTLPLYLLFVSPPLISTT